MKLVTFVSPERVPRAGTLIDNARIVDLQAAHRARWGNDTPFLSSVLAIAEGGPDALDVAAQTIKGAATAAPDAVVLRDQVKLLAPIPRPPQMRDFLCFEQHLQQAFKAARTVRAQQSPDPAAAMRDMEANGILAVPQAWYERPIFYHPNRMNVIGTDQDVVWPAYSALMDFELEFGCYIGRAGKDIPKDKAREHIFGYTIFNDFSARDEQTKEMPGQLGPGKGKDFDGSNAMGPCLVTADEIADPYGLTMVARVNGEEWGRGSSRDMHWKFEDCIAHVSRGETLSPGEFFGSGTVGNGCGLEHMRFLKTGDVVELEVEGIGVLRNRVLRASRE
jgi:2-keto-4-pentenoate hydratase/2-oxohepta-3-ene-1,7-dioic acid hydratase in catechol pathway